MAEHESEADRTEPVLSAVLPEREVGSAMGPLAVVSASRPARTRRPRPVADEETRGRKLSLPDSIHIRLWLSAQERRTTVSAIAAEILDKHLPRFRVERE